MGDVRGWIMGDWLKRLPKMMDLLSRGHNGHWWASCTHRAGRSEAQLIPLPAIGCASLACSKQLSASSFQVVRSFFFHQLYYCRWAERICPSGGPETCEHFRDQTPAAPAALHQRELSSRILNASFLLQAFEHWYFEQWLLGLYGRELDNFTLT